MYTCTYVCISCSLNIALLTMCGSGRQRQGHSMKTVPCNFLIQNCLFEIPQTLPGKDCRAHPKGFLRVAVFTALGAFTQQMQCSRELGRDLLLSFCFAPACTHKDHLQQGKCYRRLQLLCSCSPLPQSLFAEMSSSAHSDRDMFPSGPHAALWEQQPELGVVQPCLGTS